MVKTVSGEQGSLEPFVDKLFQSGISVQVGLAIGRSTGDSIISLIPTPLNDGKDVVSYIGQPVSKGGSKDFEKKKGTKGKSMLDSPPLHIDVQWVVEHAHQVEKMLVGGIGIVGIFIMASDGSFKSSLATLWQVVKQVANASSIGESKVLVQERLLLHISSSPRRLSCKSCALDSNFSSLSVQPCEWKLGHIVSRLQTFTCLYNVDIRYPLYKERPPTKNIYEVFLMAISEEEARLKSSFAIVNGCLAQWDNIISEGPSHKVNLLLPFDSDRCIEGSGAGHVIGLAILTGSVHAQAYGLPRDNMSQIIEHLKGDIIKSLRNRLAILYEDVEESAESMATMDESGPKPHDTLKSLQQSTHLHLSSLNGIDYCSCLPRRVIVPWSDGIVACDYLQESENFQNLAERCSELLGMTEGLNPSQVVELESTKTVIKRSFGEAVGECLETRNTTISNPSNCTSDGKKATEAGSRFNLPIIAAALGMAVLIFSIFTTLFLNSQTLKI